MKNSWFKRTLCALLSAVMLLGYLPANGFAAQADGLCPHHTEHTAECGYVPATQGVPCGHEHSEECYEIVTNCGHVHGDCGYAPAVEGRGCDCTPDENGELTHAEGCGYAEAVAGTPCAHVCSPESGCVTRTLNCQHVHDDACGYQEAAAEVPCAYICQQCGQEEETTAPTEEETTAPTEEETTAPTEEETTAPTEEETTAPTEEETTVPTEEEPTAPTEEETTAPTEEETTAPTEEETTAPTEEETTVPTEEETTAPDEEQMQTIAFLEAEYREEDSAYHYLLEAKEQETITLRPIPLYEGKEPLDYQWMQWDSQAEAFVPLALEEQPDALEITLPQGEGLLTYACLVTAENAAGRAVFDVQVIGDQAAPEDEGDESDEPFELESSASVIASGTCGKNLTWVLDDTGLLTISGVGAMGRYSNSLRAPWDGQREKVKSICIDSGVTSIGSYAFYECSSLTSIIIPGSVTSIGDAAFEYCTSLISITIPDSVTTIGYWAFIHCTSLTSITIPDSVTSIGDAAFAWCTSLISITIPDSVTSIGNYTFEDCYSLTSITIPDSVTTIGREAFYGCGSLTSITIPDGVTSIGEDTFNGCRSLTSITIPDSVTTIGDRAFASCRSLTSITIPDSVTTIGDLAFAWCSSLTSITIPDSVTSISYAAFAYCSSLTSITIPDSVTTIGREAFYGCGSLTSITIPDSVTTIGDLAFAWCTSLTSITVPDSVTTIGDRAFVWCTSLTSITIPDSVTTIGDGAFSECFSLTSITIPDSVTTIGGGAFYDCTSLTSITIPDSVTTIGDKAFYCCSELKDVYYAGTEQQWNQIVIQSYNEPLKNATIHYNWVLSSVNGDVRYFSSWDAENQIAYFGPGDVLGSQVTEETDAEFAANPTALLGQYVLVEEKPRTDGIIGPDILISVKAVESKTGTVAAANAASITIGSETYPTPASLIQPESYVDQFVLYHLYEGSLVRVEALEEVKGVLLSWDAQTKTMTVRLGGAAIEPVSYQLSTLADGKTVSILESGDWIKSKIQYHIDNNLLVYKIKVDRNLDVWSFSNSSNDFGSEYNGHYISSVDYSRLMSTLSKTDKASIGFTISDQNTHENVISNFNIDGRLSVPTQALSWGGILLWNECMGLSYKLGDVKTV